MCALIFTCVICILSFAAAGPSEASETRDFASELMVERDRFKKQIAATDDPDKAGAAALAHLANFWRIAAEHLAAIYEREDLASALRELYNKQKRDLNSLRRPEARQVASMHVFFGAIYTAAEVMATARNDEETLEEILAVYNNVQDLVKARDIPQYKIVVLSNGSVAMLALAARSIGKSRKQLSMLDGIIDNTVKGASSIGKREDVHYRGKLFLLALNNFRGCFEITYRFNLSLDARLSADVGPVRQALLKSYSDDDAPVRTMAVTLAALTEISCPLTMTLAAWRKNH